MSEKLQDLAAHVAQKRPAEVISAEVVQGELTVIVRPEGIVGFVQFLRDDAECRFTTLVDLTAVDWPERAERFEMVWHFLSMWKNQRIRVKAALPEDVMCPSIVDVYPAANWFEREVFDMFGILFSGHPDLRRLLTDYGFRGHPLRKDFPTTGYLELRYDEVQKRVVYEPVKLAQEYRQFDFLSPWEGAQSVLPGDEKRS